MPGGASSSYFRVGDNIELWRVVVFLSVLIVLVMVLEQLMHKTEHALKKYPKYHEMLSKIYRELMILGLLGLGIKIVKELALVDGYGKNIMAFQVADLIVFISAFALIIQAICVFSLLRAKNIQLDRDELVSTPDLIEMVTIHQRMLRAQSVVRRLWPWTRAPAGAGALEGPSVHFSTARHHEMVTVRTLRHFFLNTHNLPELFPFSKYLRQAQDNQITHMIDIEMSMWILLIFLTWVLDASTVLLEDVAHVVERHALPVMFLLFSVVLTLFHFVMAWYLRSALKKILAAAGYKSQDDMIRCLQTVAAEEARNLETQQPDKALEMMHHVQEVQESVEHSTRGGAAHGGGHGGGGHGGGHDGGGGGHDSGGHGGGSCMDHDTGFQLMALCFRRLCCCKRHHGYEYDDEGDDGADHHKQGDHTQLHTTAMPTVQIRFFSRIGIHFLVKFLIMLNGFYFAFMCQAVLYELPEIYETLGLLAAVVVPLPLLINMFVYQPQICRNFVTVACIFKVDVSTLSEVITHFSESVELRADFVNCLKQSMRESGQTIEELQAEFLAKDPARTGLMELEVLRQVLRSFGCHISFFRFNGIAKLLFRLKGTQVEYAQIERLLLLAEQEDTKNGGDANVGRSSQYPKYLNTIMTEETEMQRRERFSEDIVMMESGSFSRVKPQPRGPSQEHTMSNTGRFGLPRFNAQQPHEQSGGDSSTRAQDRDGGLSSVRGGHAYENGDV